MQQATSPIESSALRRYRLFESTDVDDTQMRIASVLQPHRLKPGPSRPGRTAYMNCARIEQISFGSIGYAGSMTVDAGEVADYYLVILGLRGYGDVSVGSQRMIVGQSQGILISPRTAFAGTFSDDCEQYFLRVSRDAVHAHSGYEHLRIEPTMDMSRRELAPLDAVEGARRIAGNGRTCTAESPRRGGTRTPDRHAAARRPAAS
jgi:hypothetical protein